MEGKMSMAVSDRQVAALRALLTGNVTENRRLLGLFDRVTDGIGYSTLVSAAFYEAVNRRFGKGSQLTDAIEYVADVRSRSADLADKLDPSAGEQLIREVLTDDTTDDIDSRTSARAKLFLLAALVADEDFGGAELDQFLARVRKMADYLLRDS
jgi:hypothetical protein